MWGWLGLPFLCNCNSTSPTHKYSTQTNTYTKSIPHGQVHANKNKWNPCTPSIHKQVHTNTHTLRKSISGRWRSPTGDCYKLAGWCCVILLDGESTLGPMGVSGYLWGKLLASSAQWHHSNRKQKSMRAREWEYWWNYRIKHLTSLPHFPTGLFMKSLWLGVTTEPDTGWSPKDLTHLRPNWTRNRWHKEPMDTRQTLEFTQGWCTTCTHTPTSHTGTVTQWLLEWWIRRGSNCLEYCMESGAGGESQQ